MEIFRTIDEMRSFVTAQRVQNRSVGLVPTMGALHEGHMKLVENAASHCDIVVCSIFVNPSQFNNPDDLKKYPRNEASDLKKLESRSCQAVFIPSIQEMYPDGGNSIKISFGALENVMEGKFRCGHFSGVGTIVAKLLNIVLPEKAFFGKKDLQQLAVIKKLVNDLNFPTEIIGVDTVREKSGMAMSSRNQLLSEAEKITAAHLYEGLLIYKEKLKSRIELKVARQEAIDFFNEIKNFEIEYLEMVNVRTMEILNQFSPSMEISICAAATVHGVRIIDNISLGK